MTLMVNKLMSTLKVLSFYFAPAATTATEVSWQPMRDFGALLVQFVRAVGTSNVAFAVYVATDDEGSDKAELVAKTLTAGTQPNAAGDYVFLEVLASQVRQKAETDGKKYTHVSVVASVATGADTGVVNYVFGEPRFAGAGLTADYISA